MPLTTLSRRLRIAATHWLSKDHRDFQTVGRLAAWWSQRSQPSSRPAAFEDQPRYSHLPALSTIVRSRREGAILHVELFARCAAPDERPLVLAQDGASSASDGATPDQRADPGPAVRTWTVTLTLN